MKIDNISSHIISNVVTNKIAKKPLSDDCAARIIQNAYKKYKVHSAYKSLLQNRICSAIFTKNKISTKNESSVTLLNILSFNYLNKIKSHLGLLTQEEEALIQRFTNSKWIFKHQSENILSKGVGDDNFLNIASHRLTHSKIQASASSNTTPFDIKELGNDDFVFFSTEIKNELAVEPKYIFYRGQYYGDYCYVIDDTCDSCIAGYLTLTDHLFNGHRGFVGMSKDIEYFSSFIPNFEKLIKRRIHAYGLCGIDESMVFSFRDMKIGFSLHLIAFIRESKSPELKNYCLKEELSLDDLNRIMNTFFSPEFHIPRRLTTKDFCMFDFGYKHKLYLDGIALDKKMKLLNLCKDEEGKFNCWYENLVTIKSEKLLLSEALGYANDILKHKKANRFAGWANESVEFKSSNNPLCKLIKILQYMLSFTDEPKRLNAYISKTLTTYCGFNDGKDVVLQDWFNQELRVESFDRQNPESSLLTISHNSDTILSQISLFKLNIIDYINMADA